MLRRVVRRADGGKGAVRAGARGGGISTAEARSILDLKPNATPQEIEAAYTRMHGMNNATNGGSAYLQAKIANARAALSADEPPAAAADGKADGAKGGSAGSAK